MSNVHAEAGHSFDTAYQNTRDMYGIPYQELQDYFRGRPTKGTVLDLGCGQGRDALFLASIGYEVTAVDSSKVGVEQMLQKAEERNLHIEGIVADILELKLGKGFDITLFDMILHAFSRPQQAALLEKYSNSLTPNGALCIVFPDDIKTDHFLEMLKALPYQWELKDERIVRDVPKLQDEDADYTFVMITVRRVDSE